MALTGLQIFKYLPGGVKGENANCKQCGFPTCMAFAMKLAKGETDISKCPFVTEELKALFDESSTLQQQEISFGNKVKVGNETVMFRHEKTFVNPTAITISISSSDKDFDEKLEKISKYSIERVGVEFKIDAVALSDDNEAFEECAIKITEKNIPLILISDNSEKIEAVLEKIKTQKPLVWLKNSKTETISDISKKFDCPVVVSGENVFELVENSENLLKTGVDKIVLNLEKPTIEDLTHIRRSAIENKFKPLGFPVISFATQKPCDVFEETISASMLLCKYSNIVVLRNFDEASLASLFTLRQNVFTDPQKPLQVEAKIYDIGEVDENSPILVTTNFALTYFAVVSEVEASGIPTRLVITPSDGMSVLTAWSASKFTGEIIAKAFKEFGLNELTKQRKLIIPGFVDTLKEEIEEYMPDWEVVIGPNEAIEIVDFLKKYTS